MAKRKSNWSILKKQQPKDTLKYRDVYEDQQLERGSLAEKETMLSRNIMNGAICLVVFLLLWMGVSFVEMLFSGGGGIEMSDAPAAVWIPVAEHYENVNDGSDKISLDEFAKLKEAYDAGGQTVVEEPVEPTKPNTDDYMFESGGYMLPNQRDTWMPAEEFENLNAKYEEEMNEYRQKLAEYKAYKKATTDPSTVYTKIPLHYRNRNNLSEAIHEDEYKAIEEKYNKQLSKGKISADMRDVPVLPYDPSEFWKGDSFGTFQKHKVDEEGNDVLDENGMPVMEEVEGALTYRNVLDGTVITNVEYDELVNKYNQDIEKFKAQYHDHRLLYHPTDVDGTQKTFSWAPTKVKFGISFGISAILFSVLYILLKRNLAAANLSSEHTDINQYHNDQHVALPEEVQKTYDWFPDVGAHSAVQVSSMLSHMALSNKGLKKIEFAKRAEEDIKDEDGNIEYYKGEILNDEDDNPITEMVPIIDEKFMEDLFEASGALDDKDVRKRYDATKIPYNGDGKNRDKLGKYETVADLINDDWEFPIYEPQRPGGAYVVDTAPVNTMVLAITRAGKGQTVIEPTLDMWMREKRLNNMVVNDPKGELLVKNYVRATVRGLQVVQFNLINAMKTDIYNPLAMAADAAREGDQVKCAMYVENIAEVFFPLDGGDDPVWPNAANNAFKRAAYGLIDYYLEEEKAMRRLAERTKINEKVLEQKIDAMWGKVTLYNCYQLFVQLSSKKMKNPAVEFSNQAKAGKFNDLSDAEYEIELNKVKNKSKLWEDKPDADLLTLYFNATDMLPKNSMRTLVSNANNALRSMGGAEKMMASVYGIAITAMSFFTDPTISTLTSGTLNQNVDLGSLSFPRRMGVRFHSDFLQKYHFIGLQCVWNAYEDINFTKCLGKDFYHEDMITREGWARYFFDGKFKNDKAYVKLEVKNPTSDILVRTFYFEFQKSYQTSLDGRVYIKDPVLDERIVKNGIVTELRKFKKKDGTIVFRKAKTTFKQKKILDIKNKGEKQEVNISAIVTTMCKYAEKPKAVFLVTPPHLMKYAKLILILIKQLVDLNFDKSYMTKSNQKPLYRTRFMLDELGNLQSEGHGISGFETMLSIGLGQEQQFTLILQTLQQLRDVYGESVDKIVQGNTSNIVFLKSTDDSMLDTLQKMSGTKHKTYADSKTITKDIKAIFKMQANEGKESITYTTKEEPVISYNDMAFIPERNSIVFRAGDAPIWNRNETILPMSWRLFQNTIQQPGKKYSLMTIPTLSTAMDFDVRKNQPNFSKMLEKRMEQAYISQEAQQMYRDAYGYEDYDIEQLDPDAYADEIMDLICSTLNPQEVKDAIENQAAGNKDDVPSDGEYEEMFDYIFGNQSYKKNNKFTVEQDIYNEFDTIEDNKEVMDEAAKAAEEVKSAGIMRYAGKQISRDMIVSKTGINHGLDSAIIRVYKDIRIKMENDEEYFTVNNGSLCGKDGSVYIKNLMALDDQKALNDAAKDENSRLYADQDISKEDIQAIGSFEVTDAFLRFLVTFPKAWPFADGEFESRMKSEMLGTDETVA